MLRNVLKMKKDEVSELKKTVTIIESVPSTSSTTTSCSSSWGVKRSVPYQEGIVVEDNMASTKTNMLKRWGSVSLLNVNLAHNPIEYFNAGSGMIPIFDHLQYWDSQRPSGSFSLLQLSQVIFREFLTRESWEKLKRSLMTYVVPMIRPGHFARNCEARVSAPGPSLLRFATSVFYEWYILMFL